MSQNVQHFFCASSNFDQKLWLLWLFGHSLWKYHTILWTALESRSTWIWQSSSIRLSWYYWLIHLQYQSICVKVIANNLYCSNCNYCLRSALDIRQHLYIDLSMVEEGWRGLSWFLFVFPAVGSAGSLVSILSAVSHPVLCSLFDAAGLYAQQSQRVRISPLQYSWLFCCIRTRTS